MKTKIAFTFLLTAAFTLSAEAAPKVIIMSLDGATPRIVEELTANGQLNVNEGLGLLRSRGFSARQNITITPSITAPAHIAIATGSSAAKNDINANSFHLLASPFASNISGFSAPIGGYSIDGPAESEFVTALPLWAPLRQAGKTVATATWPGGDGLDIRVPGLQNSPIIQPAAERTVDYTVPFGSATQPFQRGFNLNASNFAPAPQTTIDQLTAAGRPSFSPVLQTDLETFNSGFPTVAAVAYSIKAAVLDTTNDSAANYDTLVIFNQAQGIQPGPFALPSTGPAYIKPSVKISALFYFEGHPQKAGTRYFATQLAPDLSTVRIARTSTTFLPRNPAVLTDVDDINNNVGFWQPQPDFRIVERIDARPSTFASFPDSELEATYLELVREFTTYQTNVGLRAMERFPNADLVMIYLEQPDGAGHQFLLTDPRQPTDFTNPNSIGAGQDQAKVQRYRDYIAGAYQAANRGVQRIIDAVGLDANGKPNSNIIVTSDHGFDPFHTAFSLNMFLAANGFDTTKVRGVVSGPAVNFYINLQGREPNGIVARAEFVTLQQQLRDAVKNFNDTNPIYTQGAGSVPVFDKIYLRPLPADINDPKFGRNTDEFIGQDSGDVFAILRTGYNFDGTQNPVVVRQGDAPAPNLVLSVPNFYGAHGYDPRLPNMSAIFYAAGPDFGQGTIGQMENVDIAPTILKTLGVAAPASVDGGPLAIGITPPVAVPQFTSSNRDVLTPNTGQFPTTGVALGGTRFVNLGLQGIGRIPANTKDVTGAGETFGSISDMQITAFTNNGNGTYTGKFHFLPDRGFNAGTTFSNYAARLNTFDVMFTPFVSAGKTTLQNQLVFSNPASTRFTYNADEGGAPDFRFTTGLLADATRGLLGMTVPARAENTTIGSDGPLPNRLTLDPEGLVLDPRTGRSGSGWVSDEYGPYIYHFNAAKQIDGILTLPQALVPHAPVGTMNFLADPPINGRRTNQGMEGIAISPDGSRLFAMLQSATIQDSGSGNQGRSNTRILVYDLSNSDTPGDPIEQYLLKLPRADDTGSSTNGTTVNRTAAQSAIVSLNNKQLLILSRDGNGRGANNASPAFKSVLLADLSTGTNIDGDFDAEGADLTPSGDTLTSTVIPVQWTEALNMIGKIDSDVTEIEQLGLNLAANNGDTNTLSEKWEGLAFVSAQDPGAPNDYFLMIGNDNDFQTSGGTLLDASGATRPYDAGLENDTMVLAYRIRIVPEPAPAQVLNISTRLRVQTGDRALIGGFIVTGNAPKKVIIRALGPSLASSGVQGPLADPTLELFSGSTSLAANNNWKESDQAAITATGIPPVNDLEAAIVRTLDPGPYTAVVRGVDNTTGIALVEAYDLEQGVDAKLANISTRGFAEAGDNAMIAGFILGGGGGSNARVIARGIGPSLTAAGVPDALVDPTLELRDASGTLVAANDNWKENQAAVEATGIPPMEEAESAIVSTLAPGAYTAILRGKGDAPGVGLVEIYNLP